MNDRNRKLARYGRALQLLGEFILGEGGLLDEEALEFATMVVQSKVKGLGLVRVHLQDTDHLVGV